MLAEVADLELVVILLYVPAPDAAHLTRCFSVKRSPPEACTDAVTPDSGK